MDDVGSVSRAREHFGDRSGEVEVVTEDVELDVENETDSDRGDNETPCSQGCIGEVGEGGNQHANAHDDEDPVCGGADERRIHNLDESPWRSVLEPLVVPGNATSEKEEDVERKAALCNGHVDEGAESRRHEGVVEDVEGDAPAEELEGARAGHDCRF